jgi:hypothetical protein
VDLAKVKDWTRMSVSFKPAGDGTVALSLIGEKMLAGGAIYWDGVQVEKGIKPTDFAEEVVPGATVSGGNTGQNINVLLYVFTASHKQYTPGFNAEYAGYVPAKTIEKLAYNDDGSKWVKTTKKMYLTKMTRNMTQAQMTDDLVIRDAEDNKPIGGTSGGGLDEPWKVLLVLGVPIVAEVIVVWKIWNSKMKKGGNNE